ncbi:hypothetical protein QY97_03576 [Bacillus thermotolerans]|nr:hypothetical protein QY97_03576 [Bacillus thermotolerans]
MDYYNKAGMNSFIGSIGKEKESALFLFGASNACQLVFFLSSFV